MNAATDRFLSFVGLQRSRHRRRLYTASLVAVLIAVLLHATQWFYLRPGLIVLLAGQLGDVLALLMHRVQLSGVVSDADPAAWFKREEVFIRKLAFFDAACQLTGFLALGYAVWISTGSLAVALLIGLVYPVTFQFGINRRKTSGAIRELRAKGRELALLP